MQFGLWFEPEMVSLDSDLARAHPEWLLHNRAHVEAGDPAPVVAQPVRARPRGRRAPTPTCSGRSTPSSPSSASTSSSGTTTATSSRACTTGRPGVHAQMVAVYALMAELKARHPGLEIESCSSGGARTDLGVMAICDRVWASDSNDPVERQDIQRWTGLLLPPELVGAHVGPTESHSSGRTTDLSYRMATSLMGSAGFEWDISGCDEAELADDHRLRRALQGAASAHPLRDGRASPTSAMPPGASPATSPTTARRPSTSSRRSSATRTPGSSGCGLTGLDPRRAPTACGCAARSARPAARGSCPSGSRPARSRCPARCSPASACSCRRSGRCRRSCCTPTAV